MELLSSTKLTHAGKSRSLYDVFDEDKSIAWYQKSLDIDRLDLKRERRPLWRAAVAVAVRLPEVGVASVNVGCVQARIQSIARMLAVLVKSNHRATPKGHTIRTQSHAWHGNWFEISFAEIFR